MMNKGLFSVNVPWSHVQPQRWNITLCRPFVTYAHVKSTLTLAWRYVCLNLCLGDSCGVWIIAGLRSVATWILLAIFIALQMKAVLTCRIGPLESYSILTPWSRVLLVKLASFQLVKKSPSFYGTRRFITAFTRARHLSLSWASSIRSIHPHPTSWRSS